jgi:hypothetical protein
MSCSTRRLVGSKLAPPFWVGFDMYNEIAWIVRPLRPLARPVNRSWGDEAEYLENQVFFISPASLS